MFTYKIFPIKSPERARVTLVWPKILRKDIQSIREPYMTEIWTVKPLCPDMSGIKETEGRIQWSCGGT